jgi:hypothetical protein
MWKTNPNFKEEHTGAAKTPQPMSLSAINLETPVEMLRFVVPTGEPPTASS